MNTFDTQSLIVAFKDSCELENKLQSDPAGCVSGRCVNLLCSLETPKRWSAFKSITAASVDASVFQPILLFCHLECTLNFSRYESVYCCCNYIIVVATKTCLVLPEHPSQKSKKTNKACLFLLVCTGLLLRCKEIWAALCERLHSQTFHTSCWDSCLCVVKPLNLHNASRFHWKSLRHKLQQNYYKSCLPNILPPEWKRVSTVYFESLVLYLKLKSKHDTHFFFLTLNLLIFPKWPNASSKSSSLLIIQRLE